jgi:transcriptional regulator with XRE-family HTH domain
MTMTPPDTAHTNNIPDNLRRLRREMRLRQDQLAGDADLSRSGYRKIETGACTPTARTLQRLASALGVSVADLLRPAPKLTRPHIQRAPANHAPTQRLALSAITAAALVAAQVRISHADALRAVDEAYRQT